ncbi:MAG: GNAT family N-acetyltransferase [Bacillota bacterium]
MPDMLVKLYDLDIEEDYLEKLEDEGIIIKRALPPEKYKVVEWIESEFSRGWASECEAAFSRQPVSCFIAIRDDSIVGFACYNATYKDFFGPEGVSESCQGKGIGKALLLRSLAAMKDEGYAYAIIGAAGPTGFYQKVCNAEIIKNSSPGIYKNMLS